MNTSENTNFYLSSKAEISNQLKEMIQARKNAYAENCQTMKEKEAWEISYRQEKEISEWYFNQMTNLNNLYQELWRK